MESVHLATSDGVSLAGDVDAPESAVTGGVVICHPHPQYGGDRFNPVVASLFEALPSAGFVAVRFDFRREFGGGIAERLDVVAALDHLAGRAARIPLWIAGYSFGAVVALGTHDERVRGVAAVAPPLSMMPLPAPSIPTLVLSPAYDQFCPPGAAAPIVEAWPDATLEPIEAADHILAGHTVAVATRVTGWISEQARTLA